MQRLPNAACATCSLGNLRDNGPLLPESHDRDLLAIVYDFPSDADIQNGRPLSDGQGGAALQRALNKAGVPRSRVKLIPLAACRPHDGDMRKATALGKRKGLNSAYASCRAHTENELAGFKYVILLGDAVRLNHPNSSADTYRGACEELHGVKYGYSLSPNRVAIDPKWEDVFANDIGKAIRYFGNKLNWKEPEVLIIDNVADFLLTFPAWLLEDPDEEIAYDVETDGINAMTAKLRCIGFATTNRAMTIAIHRVDGTPLHSPDGQELIYERLREFLRNPPRRLVGHNAGLYDRLSCESVLGVTPKLSSDTILLHLLADNEMPHNLGFVTSYHTDFTEAWKADSLGKNAREDRPLWEYNAKDCVATRRVKPILTDIVNSRGQGHLIERELMLQRYGWAMQRVGIRVDQKAVDAHIDAFEKKRDEALMTVRELVSANFNPGSPLQLGKLLFDEWGLAPVSYSELTGAPSVDDDTLRKMYTQYDLTKDQKVVIQCIRNLRHATKILGTNLYRWSNRASHALNGYESFVGADGRIHPGYKRLAASGRYTSSDPNAQNITSILRNCFIPEDGHLFVACDADALEAKVIAEESGAERMIRVFEEKLDLHNETCEFVCGPEVWKMQGAPENRRKKGSGAFKDLRGVMKNVRYAWQYGAFYKRVWEQIVSIEDENGKLIYADYDPQRVRQIMDGLNKADPEVGRWWKSIERTHREKGYIQDSVWQRRRYFRGNSTMNEKINHPIQAGGFHIVMEAIIGMIEGEQPWFTTAPTQEYKRDYSFVRWRFRERTGMVTQTHDSSMWEVPEADAEPFRKDLEAAMTRRRKVGARLTYTAESKTGNTWEAV